MAQQYSDMYSEYNHSNRSPGSQRGYPQNGINRQPSRHFDNFANNHLSGLYTAEDHAASQYEPPHRFVDRMPSATLHSNYQYDNQTWNYGAGNGNSNLVGGTGRVKPASRRAGLPPSWMGPPPMPQQANMNSYQINENSYDPQAMQQGNERISSPNGDGEELIPTAIVIKNIPFAVKKEQLVALMTDMRLPLPYAFNYHFDSGIFRGLAFANFTTSEETAQVIQVMNHLELQGRKLRVEYKKMLPTMERERIEREKRQKRGQLEEQHRPLAPNQVPHPLHAQASVNSLSSNHHPSSPSPNSVRGGKPEIDLNDPVTLNFYNELLVFKNSDRETLIFPSTVSPGDRRTIHTLAHHMGLEHRSEGQGETRCVQILKRGAAISPPSHSQYHNYNDTQRRGLARAATIDFSEAREAGYHNHTLGRQGSGLLDIPGSPGVSGLGAAHNLRAAKSFADLRSYTPSPAHSTASFPVGLTSNIQRYTDAYGHGSAASGTPNLTPTSANRDEAFSSLSNGLSNMNLYGPARNATGRIGQERENNASNAGPIGSQRPVNTSAFNEDARNGTTIERQPRGPGTDWGVNGGFAGRPRQNGHVNRGSGELDLNNFDNGWDDNRAQDSSDRNGAAASTNQRY